MDTKFLIPAILFLLGLAIRAGYELLKEAKKIDPESKPVFLVILAVMCVLWLSWFSLPPEDPWRADFPVAVQWAGLAVFLIGMILALGALVQLRGVENIDRLVTSGLFKKFRHPMYMGFIAWIVGWAVYHSAPLSLSIGAVGIANILWWRHIEEGRLEAQHRSAYRQYRQTTWC